MKQKLKNQCDTYTFFLYCITTILMPTQIIFGGVSWAISDFILPLLLINSFCYINDIRFTKKFIIFITSIVVQLFLSLTFVFRNPSDIIYISDSFLSIIKIVVCLIYVFLYYFFFYTINNEQHLKYLRLINIIGTVEGILCIIGPMLSYMGKNTKLIKFGYRANGTFDDPNLMAVFLLICIGITFSRFFYINTNKKRIFISISILIMSFGTFMTASKAGIFSLLFSIALIIIIANKNKLKLSRKIIKLLCTGIIIIIILNINTNIVSNILNRFVSSNGMEELTTGRSKLWLAAVKITFTDFNIIHGVGIGMYENSLEKYGFDFNNRAHNTYLSFLSECGIVLFLLIVLFLGWVFYKLYKIIKINHSSFALGTLFSLTCVIIELFCLNLQNSRTTYVFILYLYFYIYKYNLYEINMERLNQNECNNHVG